MTVSAPPRPPSERATPKSKPLDRAEIEALVEALIEEARRETRRRHRRYWAAAAVVAFLGVGLLALLEGGAASQTASSAVLAQSNAATRAGTSRIAFVRGDLGPTCRPVASCDHGLYVVNEDGTGLRRLTRNATFGPGSVGPVWSPNGRKLVFVKRVERQGLPCRPVGSCDSEIFVMSADGNGLRRLTRNAATDGSPVWLPDGGRIGFVRSIRDRNGRSSRDALYVMNADGSGQRRLTLLPRRAGGPTWSPQGEKIAFVAPSGHLGAADIFVMNTDGSGLQNVTNTAATSYDFAWSHDGRRIACLEGSPGGGRLTVVNADGTGKQRLRGTVIVDLGLPSWSPDGRTLAFTGGSVIYSVHPDGTGLRKLTAGPGWNVDPRWSPDGRRILFLGFRDGPGTDLFVMNADGSGQRNLTHSPGVSELAASWAPS